MILTKKQLMEILKYIPSDKCSDATVATQEVRYRIKDELDKIKAMEDNKDHLLLQFMSRVGYFETESFIFNYVPQTRGIVIIDRDTRTMIATFIDGKLHYLPNKDKTDITFKICSTCGVPLQTGYRLDTKNDTDRYCRTCVDFKLTEKFGKSKWSIAIEEKY